MNNGRETVNRLSADIEKDVTIRLSKIIGQLKSLAVQLDESPRDLSALTQFSSANAATGSLMRLIAKDIVKNTFDKDFYDDDDTECYLKEIFDMLIDAADENYSLIFENTSPRPACGSNNDYI